MTSTARQLRQPPTIKAIERVPYFADIAFIYLKYAISTKEVNSSKYNCSCQMRRLLAGCAQAACQKKNDIG